MRYMLDTNTVVYVLNARPRHRAVIERFKLENPREFSRVHGLRVENWVPA